MKSGIYEIKNRVNGKRYIGSSNEIERRWRQHRSELNRNIHGNRHLQNAWNKYGKGAFVFSIVKEVEVDCLLEEEQKFLLDADEAMSYNIATTAGSPMKGRRHTEEVIQVLRKKLSGENHPQWGKAPTQEHRDKISKANRKIGKARAQEIVEKYKSGIPASKLAEEYGVHFQTIYRYLDRAGYKHRHLHGDKTKDNR